MYFEGNQRFTDDWRVVRTMATYNAELGNSNWVDSDLMNAVRDFEVRYDDVFLVGYPQSGTDLLESVLRQLYGDWGTLKVTEHGRVPFLDSYREGGGFRECATATSPRLMTSHLPHQLFPRRHGISKTIVIIRNPKDVCVAYYHHLLNQQQPSLFSAGANQWDEFVQSFSAGRVPYGSWLEHVASWLDNKPPNSLFLRYELLKSDPRSAVEDLCRFLSLPTPDAQKRNVVAELELSNMLDLNEKLSFFGGDHRGAISYRTCEGVGSWKKYFSVAQSELFDVITDMLKDKGYDSTCTM